jgi:predicted nucleic acid-binding protein
VIALDTNVIIRLVTADDPGRLKAAETRIGLPLSISRS